MIFLCRNYMPLTLCNEQYPRGNMLSLYVHFLPEDIPWANNLEHNKFLQTLSNIIRDNWSEIIRSVELSEQDGKPAQFNRMLIDNNEPFVVSYTTSLSVRNSSIHRRSSLQFRENSWAHVLPVSFFPFEVSLWVVPKKHTTESHSVHHHSAPCPVPSDSANA